MPILRFLSKLLGFIDSTITAQRLLSLDNASDKLTNSLSFSMKLTTKGRYAVTAMMDLALHAKLDRVALVDIAERQKISLAYLEQLFRSLRNAGLVQSVRGAKGGYMLAKADKDISLADILVASDEQINLACGGGNTCSDVDPCLTHNLWTNLSQEFFEFLNNKKLSDLVRSRHVQTMATQQDVTQIGDIPIHISR